MSKPTHPTSGAADLPAIISGALFDFAGFLTTLDKSRAVTFSGAHEAGPAVTLLQEWSTKRGLNLDEADVSGWSSALTAQALSAAPGVTSEQRRLIGVIADKIEDGTLFQSGIYPKKDLARFVRNMLDTTPTAPAASQHPPAEQQAQPGAVYAELPAPTASIGTDDAWHEAAMRDFADRTHAARLRCKSEQARLATLWGYVRADAAPKAASGVGNNAFDHQTAADFLNGKTISDEAVRKFVHASRRAHDEKAYLSTMLLSVRGDLASREAEIALLKKALLEAEAAPQPAPAPLSDAVVRDAARYRWLRATTNYVTSNGERIDVRNMPETWDVAIDAAIAAQGGK